MLLLLLLYAIVVIIIVIIVVVVVVVIIVIIIIIFTFGNHSYLISSCSKMSWSESSYSDCITVLNAYKVNNKLLLPLNCPNANRIISCLVYEVNIVTECQMKQIFAIYILYFFTY